MPSGKLKSLISNVLLSWGLYWVSLCCFKLRVPPWRKAVPGRTVWQNLFGFGATCYHFSIPFFHTVLWLQCLFVTDAPSFLTLLFSLVIACCLIFWHWLLLLVFYWSGMSGRDTRERNYHSLFLVSIPIFQLRNLLILLCSSNRHFFVTDFVSPEQHRFSGKVSQSV